MDTETRKKIHDILDAVLDKGEDVDFGFHHCVQGVTVDYTNENGNRVTMVHYIGREYGDPIESIMEALC